MELLTSIMDMCIRKKILFLRRNSMKKTELLNEAFEKSLDLLNKTFHSKVDKVQSGDELLPGVMKLAKVFVLNNPGDEKARPNRSSVAGIQRTRVVNAKTASQEAPMHSLDRKRSEYDCIR